MKLLGYKILTFLFFYGGWGLCLALAKQEEPFIGPLVVASIIAFHLWFVPQKALEALLILSITIAGALSDTVYAYTGLIQYRTCFETFPCIAPLWVVSLWALFAMCLNHSMKWLYSRWILASILGCAGAVCSYLSAKEAGVITFERGSVRIGCYWVNMGCSFSIKSRL